MTDVRADRGTEGKRVDGRGMEIEGKKMEKKLQIGRETETKQLKAICALP